MDFSLPLYGGVIGGTITDILSPYARCDTETCDAAIEELNRIATDPVHAHSISEILQSSSIVIKPISNKSSVTLSNITRNPLFMLIATAPYLGLLIADIVKNSSYDITYNCKIGFVDKFAIRVATEYIKYLKCTL